MKLVIQWIFLALFTTPVHAVDRTFQTQVEDAIRPTLPNDKWFVRASWRDKNLVVYVSPPISESFQIWYDDGRQTTMLQDVCKAIPNEIWKKIQPDQDVAVEQVVGGNGGKGSWQFPCKEYLAESKKMPAN